MANQQITVVGSGFIPGVPGIYGNNTVTIPNTTATVQAVLTPVNTFIYTPPGWDTAWRTAKANLSTQQAFVTAIGDSITAGQNATDIMIDSWFARLRSSVLAANSNALGGDYYGLLYSALYGMSTATPPVVVNASATGFYCGFNYGAFSNGTNINGYVTCTPPYAVTGFDILYIDYAAGSWTYNVDGGSNTTVTTAGPGTAAGAIVKKVSITGLTAGTHTLNINGTSSASNTCNILGVTGYASTSSGVCFANMGWSGMGLVTGQSANNALSDTGKFPPDRLALYQGYQGTTAAPSSLSGLGFPAQPDLAILALGVNDANQGVSRANFRDALERLVYSLRYGKSMDACSIIIAPMFTADGTVASSTAVTNQDYTSAGVTAYHDLKAAMLEVAQVCNCAYVDVHSAFGRRPVTNGWIHSTSDIHPTSLGYQKIATLLGAIV